jgi:hypothetical protein
LIDAELVKNLRTVITEASEDLGVAPYSLQYNQLQRWAKETETSFLFDNAAEIRRAGGFTAIRDAEFPAPVDETAVTKAKVKAAAKQNRLAATEAVNGELFLRRYEEIAKSFSNKFPPVHFFKPVTKTKSKKAPEITRELNVLLSDLHIGANLDPATGVPTRFGVVEEARRLSQVVKQVCEYKNDERRDETRLRVHFSGDIIQGKLHDPHDGAAQTLQVKRAIWLLTQVVRYFAAHFREVVVDCSTGNHDRNIARHPGRGVNGKEDSWANAIYFAVKMATDHLSNVTFELTDKPFVTFDSFGVKVFGTHGDTILEPGYPGSTVNVKKLESQINKINASLEDKKEYRLWFLGHVHVGMMLHMGNGAILITNGALIPPDEYAISIGLFENQCGQWMWESVPGHVVGDSRFISVNTTHDKDASLDKYIKPYPW